MTSRLHSLLAVIATVILGTVYASCDSSDSTEEEFPQWQQRNTAYFDSIYQVAKTHTATGEWNIYRHWALNEGYDKNDYDHVAVRFISRGPATGNLPNSNDTLRLHIEGRLIPSASYPQGYVFDRSYIGTFDPSTALPRKVALSALNDGLSTAVRQMRPGDEAEVYVPYQLGFGNSTGSGTVVPSTTATTVPAYSLLRYRVILVATYPVGSVVPPMRIKTR